MSKLDPRAVKQSGFTLPALAGWSNRAMQPEAHQQIVDEVRAAMPASSRPQDAPQTVAIADPTIGFLNLAGAAANPLLATDRAEIGRLFPGNAAVATAAPPRSDVLFVYCAIEPSGTVVGYGASLRDLIAASGARIAVVASEVATETLMNPDFQRSLGGGQHPPVNLIITGRRNGEAFPRFFKALFELMWSGVPMPLAWVKLAPQGPRQPDNIPGTICLLGAGHLVFQRRP
jgi:hypothetical protein